MYIRSAKITNLKDIPFFYYATSSDDDSDTFFLGQGRILNNVMYLTIPDTSGSNVFIFKLPNNFYNKVVEGYMHNSSSRVICNEEDVVNANPESSIECSVPSSISSITSVTATLEWQSQ